MGAYMLLILWRTIDSLVPLKSPIKAHLNVPRSPDPLSKDFSFDKFVDPFSHHFYGVFFFYQTQREGSFRYALRKKYARPQYKVRKVYTFWGWI